MSSTELLVVVRGAAGADASPVLCSVWMPILPSNEAVARRSGLRGHQAVWKDQLVLEGSWGGLGHKRQLGVDARGAHIG